MSSDEVREPTRAGTIAPPPDRIAPVRRSRRNEAVGRLLDRLDHVDHAAAEVGEEISPHQPPPLPAKIRGAWRELLDAKMIFGALVGLLGVLVIVGSAPIWRLALDTWTLKVPGVPRGGTEAAAWDSLDWASRASLTQAGLFALGATLVCTGWLTLVRRAERMGGSSRRRAKVVLAVCALWAIPVLLGPPLLSNDSYSYAAQGEMSAQGLDPTAVGPAIGLGRGDFVQQVDGFWRWAPAPYGPVWVVTGKGAVVAAGHDAALSVWMFRVIALIGVVISTIGLVSLARAHKVSVPVAVAIGIGNPLVILHLLGGNHNDALMMGFLLCGVAAAKRGRRWLAVILLTLATAIKLPAIIALGIVAWQFEGTRVLFRKRVLGLAKVGGFAVVSIAALSVVAGIGLGWISALKSTGKVMDTMSVPTLTGYFLGDIVNLGETRVSTETIVNVVRMLGVLAGAGIAFKLLIQSGKVGLARAIGLSMTIMVISGPVVWPWYLPAGFALLAGSGLGKWRPSYLIGCILATVLVWPNNIIAPPILMAHQRRLMLAACVVTGVACWIAQRHAAKHGRYLADEQRLAQQAGDELVSSADAPVPTSV